MNPRKVQSVKLLILTYCFSLIVLAVRDFDYIYIEQPVYFYVIFLIPIIIAVVTLLFFIMKRNRKLVYLFFDVDELGVFELIGVLILTGLYIFGLVFAWHGVDVNTSLNIVLFVIVSIISLSGTLAYVFFWNHHRKERRRATIVTIDREIAIAKSKQQKIDLDNVKNLLGFGPDIDYSEVETGYVFTVPEHHLYADFFERIKVYYDSAFKGIGLVIKLKSDSLLSLDIRKRDSIQTNRRNEFSFSPLSNVYTLNSQTPEIWESLLSDPDFNMKLLLLRAFFEYFSLKGQYIEALVYSDTAIVKLLDWIMELNPSMERISKSIDSSDAEILLCYSCQDPFDPLEEKCNKCGAPRPRCIICFQDLKPQEEEDVVQLPCCEIYAHRNHIMTWLKKKAVCPNCHHSLSRWMNQTHYRRGF